MYLDTSYILKFYLTEPESVRVRDLVHRADFIQSSLLALPEFHAGIHRKHREGSLSFEQALDIVHRFMGHVDEDLWNLVPVTGMLLRNTGTLIVSAPADLYIRTADAVHLATARQQGEHEIWTNDRHMLKAAAYFGLKGCSV